jgi:pilus assembly protein CpaB
MLRKIIGIVAALLLAGVGTIVLVLYVQSAEQRALAGERTVNVLVLHEAVAAGTPAGQLAASVKPELVPAKVQAVGSVESLDELEGLVAAVELVSGEQVVAQRFVEPVTYAARAAVEIPPGLLQVTVSLSPDRALGGRITPGDTVGVLASFSDGISGEGQAAEGEDPASEATTHLILHKVLVTNVQGGVATTTSPSPTDEEPGTDQSAVPGGSLLVSLALDAASVERVVFAAEFGSLWLSDQPADAEETGTQIQTKGRIYQ